MNIFYYKHSDLPPNIYRQLLDLNFGEDGGMYTVLTETMKTNPTLFDFYVFVEDWGVVTGWALVSFNKAATEGVEIDIFVDPKYQNQGVGSVLLKAVQADIPDKIIDAYPFDQKGIDWFTKRGVNCREIRDWIPIE